MNGKTNKSNGRIGAVMVVGGGIGGMQASLDLANSGYKVYLIENTTAIGGRMAQLDKTFPTNDCSMCTISPKLIETGKHLNIDIITNTEIQGIEGEAGNFSVEILKKPRYIDIDKCSACGDCIAVCPIDLPSEFDEGTMDRHAVYKRYPQAIPNKMAISKADRAPCVMTCPTNINVQGYVALVAKKKFEEAYNLILERNPLPSICGRVCHHPCEGECNRGEIDEPVAINNIKRFVADYVKKNRAETGYRVEKAEIDPEKPKIAVIGGGPSGLTCARDLILDGFPVTIFEAEEKLGGAMRFGIPRYRLPEENLDWDIQNIVDLGIDVKTKTRLGEDFTIKSLKDEGYKAVYLGVGLPQSRKIPFEGADQNGVIWGLDFLRDVSYGNNPKVGKKVVVIGGGNVAIDVAMTAKRQGAEKVEVVSLECREEMPAHEWEIQDAIDEGIELNPSWGPDKILGKNGNVTGLKLVKCTCVFDPDGKFDPQYDNTCKEETDADTIIIAVGQGADLEWIGDDSMVEKRGGGLAADPLTLSTNIEGVFTGGDVAYGPKSVVEAINQGHEAAESIRRFVDGKDLAEGREKEQQPTAKVPEDRPYVDRPREYAGKTPVDERAGTYKEVEHTFTEEMAVDEASRCLACGICCECMQCVAACQAGAILHDDKPVNETISVGSLILIPGYEPFNPRLKGIYGYDKFDNVITSLEFERVMSASGPYQGHILRPSDRKEPKKVAWIQCVGSRDVTLGKDYCSSVCCMYATKQAIMSIDHVHGLEASIFYNDIRAYGKGFERYYRSAEDNYGVKYIKGMPATVEEDPETKNIRIKYVNNATMESIEEEFDLLILSVGLSATKETTELAERLGVELNRFGFCESGDLTPNQTNKPGIFVAGAYEAPMDIPETVMGASSAAALASEILAEERGTLVRDKEFPPEVEVTDDEPRVGVFVCRCGTNIANVVNVPDVLEYTKDVPYVVYAEENLYTCSTDTQQRIIDAIKEHNLNRVVVASCTPRTHESLFQETIREGGLNKYLFEMANIRDQCSWVHASNPEGATGKAKDLVRMAVSRAKTLEPIQEKSFKVNQKGLVIGGGVSGMTAALKIANQGFDVFLIERENELGGIARRIHYTLNSDDVQSKIDELEKAVREHERIKLYTGTEITDFTGHVGEFITTISTNGTTERLEHGVVVVATGGAEYKPEEYLYGKNPKVITQLELEEKIVNGESINNVVMIQCVGSREEGHMYCCRVGCNEAVKNSLKLKEKNPGANVTVLYRDMRTYSFNEIHYRNAREKGVLFVKYEADRKPEVIEENDGLTVKVFDDVLKRNIEFEPDYLVLTSSIRPHPLNQEISKRLKVSLNSEGFFMEAHMKLRPLDFAFEGIFQCGIAHNPKLIGESISQAQGTASRAATILSKEELNISGSISVVDSDKCIACLTCVRACPYDVPVINEDGVAFIEPASCHGCGICAVVCPRQAISVRHYKDKQIASKCEAVCDSSLLSEVV